MYFAGLILLPGLPNFSFLQQGNMLCRNSQAIARIKIKLRGQCDEPGTSLVHTGLLGINYTIWCTYFRLLQGN